MESRTALVHDLLDSIAGPLESPESTQIQRRPLRQRARKLTEGPPRPVLILVDRRRGFQTRDSRVASRVRIACKPREIVGQAPRILAIVNGRGLRPKRRRRERDENSATSDGTVGRAC